MPEFDQSTLAHTNDADDQERSDDGHSRYGAYLRINASQFHDEGYPLTAAQFAMAAWRTATGPVMAPGYVRIRPDLHHLAPEAAGEDYDRLALRITVPLRHYRLHPDPGIRFDDWQRDRSGWDDVRFNRLVEPDADRRPALLASATLLVPVPLSLLPVPTQTRPGPRLTAEAKLAVNALVDLANHHAQRIHSLTGGAR
ncbi:hypothetical protein ACFW1A_16000 [Kitasatospora sp. NPDC058965]|uniref:hypothetical protein n=1 Tax=Kitasatospora sp. NPDC058965 TaxID=3346682 RepID=UPI0036CC988D